MEAGEAGFSVSLGVRGSAVCLQGDTDVCFITVCQFRTGLFKSTQSLALGCFCGFISRDSRSQVTCRSSSERSRRLELDASEEAQVEGAGDLDGFQGDGGGAEREGDGIDHLRVHQ